MLPLEGPEKVPCAELVMGSKDSKKARLESQRLLESVGDWLEQTPEHLEVSAKQSRSLSLFVTAS